MHEHDIADEELSLLQACQSSNVEFNTESNTPSAAAAALTNNPKIMLVDLVGKVQPSTASKYLRQWRRMRYWALVVKGVAWQTR